MPTQAISSYGVIMRMGDGVPLAPLAIAGATNATPIVVDFGMPHGVVDVSFGTVAGVLGNLAANGAWVVERVNATALKLRGSVGNGAYAGGGTLTLDSTYAPIAEITDLGDLGGSATLVDVTSHDSDLWGSQIPTFLAGDAMRLMLNHVPADPTHGAGSGLMYVLNNRVQRPFLVLLPDGATGALKTVWHVISYVTGWRSQMPVNGALTAEATLTPAGPLTLART